MALTPRQQRVLLEIAANWGHVFYVPFGFIWLCDKKLVVRASDAEVDAHYRGIAEQMDETRGAIARALANEQWEELKRQAEHAAYLAGELHNRAEERNQMAVLSRLGRATVDMLREKQAKAVGAAQ